MPDATEFDVLIAGGGPVGAVLAHALAPAGMRIGVVEAAPIGAVPEAGSDNRVLALSLGSRRILDALGIWGALRGDAIAIGEIHVSDRGHFGCARFDAAAHGVPAFGYVVPAALLGRALMRGLPACPGVSVLAPAEVREVRLAEAAAEVAVARGDEVRTLRARLLVAADGGRSAVRRSLGIGAAVHDFEQVAIVANVVAARAPRNRAFERFTATGPLALLPVRGGCGLIWTVPPALAEELLALDDGAFLARLGAAFGTRLGRFSRVDARRRYPVRTVRSNERVRARLAIIGNAANTLHPVAGQGLNLGLRDAAALADVVVDAAAAGGDPGALEHLRRFAAWRRPDQATTAWFTSGLVAAFTRDLGPLAAVRGAGLAALALIPGLERQFARHAMGLAGRQSRLGRGIAP